MGALGPSTRVDMALVALEQKLIEEFNFTTEAGLNEAIEAFGDRVHDVIKTRYATVRLDETFDQLVGCGSLIYVAMGSSIGHEVGGKVSDIGGSYGPFTTACERMIVDLRDECMKALDKLSMACEHMASDKMSKSLEKVKQLAEQAKAMQAQAKTMVDKAEELRQKSHEALVQAAEEKYGNEVEKQETMVEVAKQTATSDSLHVEQEYLAEEISQASHEAAMAQSQADTERDRAFAMQMLGVVVEVADKAANIAVKCYNPIAGVGDGLAGQLLRPAGEPAPPQTVREPPSDQPNPQDVEARATGMKQMAQIREEQKAFAKKKRDLQAEIIGLEAQLTTAGEAQLPEIKQQIAQKQNEVEDVEAELFSVQDMLGKIAKSFEQRADTAEARAVQMRERKYKLLKEERNVAANLKSALVKLEYASKKTNRLEQAIAALHVTWVILGKILVTFERTLVFWQSVENHCSHLSVIDQLVEAMDEGMKRRMRQGIVAMAASWLALGKIMTDAHVAMVQAVENHHAHMANLPNALQCKNIIEEQVPALLDGANKYSDQIEGELKDLTEM